MGVLDLLLTFLWSCVFGKGDAFGPLDWLLALPLSGTLDWLLVSPLSGTPLVSGFVSLGLGPFPAFCFWTFFNSLFLVLFLVLGLVLEHSPLFLVFLRLDFVQEVGNQWLFSFATPLMDSVFLSYGSWVLV
jgi:hypothetical protein